MVRGLEVFRDWFADHANQYVLIGGTAAQVAMEAEGAEFRATKDLDVVLVVEALSREFGERFWEFIEEGGYEIRQNSDGGSPTFYRFQKPTNERFPAMVELFARTPDLLRPIEPGHLTPIPIDEAVPSLSAILLDEDYYAFILAGRREINGLTLIGEDRLIPLKALAWMELRDRRDRGESVDSKTVRKHINDVVQLSALLTEETRIELQGRLVADMRRFLTEAAALDPPFDPAALGLGRTSAQEVIDRLRSAFGLDDGAGAPDPAAGPA